MTKKPDNKSPELEPLRLMPLSKPNDDDEPEFVVADDNYQIKEEITGNFNRLTWALDPEWSKKLSQNIDYVSDFTKKLQHNKKDYPQQTKEVFEELVQQTVTDYIIQNIQNAKNGLSEEERIKMAKHIETLLTPFCDDNQAKTLAQDTRKLVDGCINASKEGKVERVKNIIKEFFIDLGEWLFGNKGRIVDDRSIHAFKKHVRSNSAPHTTPLSVPTPPGSPQNKGRVK